VLSVVMPVRNGASFLDASISSILSQTLTDFEFVILDDASTDGSLDVVRGWARKDARIRVVESATPLGLAGSADRVMREARGSVCARMDADDVSHPDRLASQWAALDAHPAASVIGTLWRGIDPTGRPVRPSDRWRLLRQTTFAPFTHGSIMFRREWGVTIGGYRERCAHWEDLDFYIRMARLGPIYVVAKPLYFYRFHSAMSTATRAMQAIELMYRCTDLVSRGEDYAEVLDLPTPAGATVTDPRAIRTLAAPRIWAGERPGIPAAWRSSSSWHPLLAAVQTLALGTWGEVSPKSLRSALAVMVRSRDLVAALWITDGSLVPWTPQRTSPSRVAHTLAPDTTGK
jgi:Glycosyl transferase family 2